MNDVDSGVPFPQSPSRKMQDAAGEAVSPTPRAFLSSGAVNMTYRAADLHS